ncbi:hypothetical protein ABX026_01395 [Snodgrassella alvi]|uniref:hypothetical protein n=1 Tax=Snodgrassella alvi TaxID=1196083 RepID=UPI00345F249A
MFGFVHIKLMEILSGQMFYLLGNKTERFNFKESILSKKDLENQLLYKIDNNKLLTTAELFTLVKKFTLEDDKLQDVDIFMLIESTVKIQQRQFEIRWLQSSVPDQKDIFYMQPQEFIDVTKRELKTITYREYVR